MRRVGGCVVIVERLDYLRADLVSEMIPISQRG